MAITYGAAAGTVVTSYAMNETLGDQSQQSGNNQVVVSDDISTAGNGQIGTKYTTYVSRKVIINLSGTPEERMVVSQANGTGNTVILTVNEDWGTNPAQSDTIHVMYNIDDIETGGAGGGIGLNSKTGLYELSNVLTVGNGTDPAGLLLHEATALECDDRGVNNSMIVKSSGRFDVGYLQAEQAVSGGIITSYNNADGEPWIEWQSGSLGFLRDVLLWSQLKVQLLEHLNGAGATLVAAKIYSGTYGAQLFDAKFYDCIIQGEEGASELIRLDAGTVINGLILISTEGLTTANGDTTTETITIRDVVFIGNNTLLTINSNKTWNVINPVWSVNTANQGDIDFLTATSNSVNEKYSVDAVIQEADGTKLQNALVAIYENTQLDDLVQELVSNVSGVAAGSWIYKVFTDNAGTSLSVTTYGGHALRVDKWLFLPFIATQISNEAFNAPVTLVDDPNIVQTTQATALSEGTGIIWNEDTNSSSIIKFTGGNGTLSASDGVTGGSSTASGIMTKIIDGDSTAGTIHLNTRDAVNFSGTEGLSNGAGWTATLTNGSQQDFTIWVDGNGLSLQKVHDYFAALTSETTLSGIGELIHEWGRDSRGRALYATGSSFFTERSYSKGVIVVDYGAGTLDQFTDNSGGTYVPPTSVTLTIHVQDEATANIVGASVRIEKKSDGSQVSQNVTDANGDHTDSYSYVGDLNVDVVVRKSSAGTRYFPVRQAGTVDSNGLSVTITMIEDSIVL